MIKKPKDIIINKNHTVLECFRLLNDTGFRVLVCLEGKRLLGIITDGDIRRGILAGMKLEDEITPIINPDPVVVPMNMSKNAVLALMKEKKIDPVIIVDSGNKFVGLYGLNELVQSMALPNMAVIMAGGLGTRLMPLTKNVPKPLLKVGGKPIIEHLISNISEFGIESFYITVNYKSEMIKNHLKNGSSLGVKIDYLEEKEQLGTIGAINLLDKNVIKHPFIVMNGDILTRVNFKELIEYHTIGGKLLTVCLANYQYNVPFGVVEIFDDRIVGINEKPNYDFHINAGIYCLTPEVIDFIPKDTYFDITMLIKILLEGKIPIGFFSIKDYWRDIGNPEDYSVASRDCVNENYSKS